VRVSVVIPTLNESSELSETLAHLRLAGPVTEVIVADGGSRDSTADLARAAGCRVIAAPRGRGFQLRAGAQAATGDAILFLHADTWLPAGGMDALIETLQRPGVVGGAFAKAFRNPHWLMIGSRWKCRVRMHLWRFAYGDQGVFVLRSVLERIGGVPAVPLMEEHELFRRLVLEGNVELANATVLTSARRFRASGILTTYLRMILIETAWRMGVAPSALVRAYRS
jgi:rSAM/selenodomain-associated transferase 2